MKESKAMTPLGEALRNKFESPQAALHALGLDEALLKRRDVTGDSFKEFKPMSKTVLTRKAAVAHGALIAYLQPKLAQDAKIDLTPVLAKVSAKNFTESKAGIVSALKDRTKGKLAQDANIDDVLALLNSIETLVIAEDEDKSDDDVDASAMDEDDKDEDDKKNPFSKDKKKGARDKKMGKDEDKEDDKKKSAEDEADEDDKDDKKKSAADEDKDCDTVKKPAMDAAIAVAVKVATDAAIKTQGEIRDAERAVRPYVGDLAMAHDSAEGVYRTALKILNVPKADTIHASALSTVLEMQPLPGANKKTTAVAMDAAGAKSFSDRYPDAARITNI